MSPLLLALLLTSVRAPGADTVRISLQQAMARARAVSPAVLAARGSLAAARGVRSEAGWPVASNPHLSYTAGPSKPPAGRARYDFQWTLSQSLEVAGQSFLRASAAGDRVRAAQGRLEDAGRRVGLGAARAWLAARMAVRRERVEVAADSLARRLDSFAGREFAAGGIGRLDRNAAILSAVSARTALDRARAERDTALAALARVLGFPSDSVPWPSALPPLPELSDVVSHDSALVVTARLRRPDIAAAELAVRAARQEETLAHRSLVPDLDLGGFAGHQEGDAVVGLSVGISLPVFHRQQAAIGLAEERASGAEAALLSSERSVRAQVEEAAIRFDRGLQAARQIGGEALKAARENAALSERALEAGELAVPEVVTLRAQALAVQLDHLAALESAYRAWFDLAAALDVEPEALAGLVRSGRVTPGAPPSG